jgi:tRNA A-37 threonylcarbamoyl transferase component Bud32
VEETPIGSLPAGTLLGNYELGRMLGRGGMGAVYEGRHRSVHKRVAIKVLLPHLAASKSSTQRFLREAEAAGRVRHPHTVDVTDVGVSESIPFIVMEYLEGQNLADRLEQTGPLPVDAAVDLMLPVCSALGTAHDEGVVHRDLKPENIFLAHTRAGSEIVKVLDFGISHIAQNQDEVRLTATNSVIGTPRYMSPEQTRGARFADAKSDQYSLGVMLYQCLTGALPFDGDSFLEILEKMANKKIVPPSQLRDEIPSGLELIVMRTLAKDPKKRFGSMRELALALLPFASERGRLLWEPAFAPGAAAPREAHTLVLERDTTVKLRSDSGRSRNALAAAIVALLVLGAGTFGVVAWWLRPETPDVTVSPLPPSAPPTATTTLPSTTEVATPEIGTPEVAAGLGAPEPPVTNDVPEPPPTMTTASDPPRSPRPRVPGTTTVPDTTEPASRGGVPETTRETTTPVTTERTVRPPRETTMETTPRVGPNGAAILH